MSNKAKVISSSSDPESFFVVEEVVTDLVEVALAVVGEEVDFLVADLADLDFFVCVFLALGIGTF